MSARMERRSQSPYRWQRLDNPVDELLESLAIRRLRSIALVLFEKCNEQSSDSAADHSRNKWISIFQIDPEHCWFGYT